MTGAGPVGAGRGSGFAAHLDRDTRSRFLLDLVQAASRRLRSFDSCTICASRRSNRPPKGAICNGAAIFAHRSGAQLSQSQRKRNLVALVYYCCVHLGAKSKPVGAGGGGVRLSSFAAVFGTDAGVFAGSGARCSGQWADPLRHENVSRYGFIVAGRSGNARDRRELRQLNTSTNRNRGNLPGIVADIDGVFLHRWAFRTGCFLAAFRLRGLGRFRLRRAAC